MAKSMKKTSDLAKAKNMKETTDCAKAMNMKKNRDRAEAWKCVRFNDNNGFRFKFNETDFPDESSKEMFHYSVKWVEQVMRRLSPTSVAMKKRFQKFRKVSESLKPMAYPEGFQSLTDMKKRETVEKLVYMVYNELAEAMRRAPVQADSPDDMQLGEGSGPDPASEGVANTLRPPDESSLQNVLLGSVRREGSPGVHLGPTLDQGCCTLIQPDNPEGRPPPSSRQCLHKLNHLMSDVEFWASRYPDMLPEFHLLKQPLILYVNKLKDRDLYESLSLESRSYLRRGSLEEIPSQLPERILAEHPQNQHSQASMEDGFQDIGFQGSYYPARDFGVKNIETPTPGGEDGLLRNRSISEALEVVPRLTGRYRKNVGDIRPEVYRGSADGDLPSKPIMRVSMEDFSPLASDLQVNDLCSGGVNFVTMPNPGGNNTLQIVGTDRFVSAGPSADEREQLSKWQFDMPVEDLSYLWHSPVRHVSIDTLPA